MAKPKRIPSQDLGLELGLLMARYMLGTEDLHYGLWKPGNEVKLANMPAAQEAHTELILEHIPQGVKRILDVGCGAGVIAERLVQRGYQVDAVAPASQLLESAKARLGDRARVFESRFEEWKHDDVYDLVMFSESFQYVPLDQVIPCCQRVLRPGGHILICDFFKRPGMKGGPISGGHKLHEFEKEVARRGLVKLQDIDITDETAPNLDLVNDFLQKVGKPAYESVMDFASKSRPFWTRVARWWFREKFEKIEHKYFEGRRTGAAFREYKSYRLFLLQLPAAAQA